VVLVLVAAAGVGALIIAGGRTRGSQRATNSARVTEASLRSLANSAGRAVDPAVFATGSCVSFPPTSGHRGETVFLDAGHGGIDPGGIGVTESGTTIYEADETLPVELDVMALLRAQGFGVVVSRTGASTVLRLGPGDASDNVLTLQGARDEVAAPTMPKPMSWSASTTTRAARPTTRAVSPPTTLTARSRRRISLWPTWSKTRCWRR
jgi:hypothetical protein